MQIYCRRHRRRRYYMIICFDVRIYIVALATLARRMHNTFDGKRFVVVSSSIARRTLISQTHFIFIYINKHTLEQTTHSAQN